VELPSMLEEQLMDLEEILESHTDKNCMRDVI
jgi:hypothetical protein